MFKSIAWKALYGFIVTILGVATGYVNANPDIQSWTITAFTGAAAVAVVAFVKKFAVNSFLNSGE